MIPLGREQSQFGSDRVMASDHPRIVNCEPTGRSSLQAIGGSIGKYSDGEYSKSAAASAPPRLAGYLIANRALSALNDVHTDGSRDAEGYVTAERHARFNGLRISSVDEFAFA